MELPKSFDEHVELAFLSVFAICNDVVAGAVVDHEQVAVWLEPPGRGESSAVCRCAKLCRFLI